MPVIDRALRSILALAGGLYTLVVCVPGCSPADSSLPPILATVADFELIERSGRSVKRADLLGAPWIADFFFTSCTGPCPQLSSNMGRLQSALDGSPVKLVSITVDPVTDDPERLSAYADALGADSSRWWFLTGSEEEIYRLIRSSFLLAVERSEVAPPGERVTHATRFAVVDGKGDIRGTFDGLSEEGGRNAEKLARRLAAARNPD